MKDLTAAYLMVKFSVTKCAKKKMAFIAPVMVASYHKQLSPVLQAIYDAHIVPVIKAMKAKKLASLEVVPQLAKRTNELLEKNEVVGLRAVVTRTEFNKRYGVALA